MSENKARTNQVQYRKPTPSNTQWNIPSKFVGCNVRSSWIMDVDKTTQPRTAQLPQSSAATSGQLPPSDASKVHLTGATKIGYQIAELHDSCCGIVVLQEIGLECIELLAIYSCFFCIFIFMSILLIPLSWPLP